MSKESGINFFSDNLGLSTGSFALYYTFEEGAGVNIASVSGAQSGYSGTLTSADGFWVKPGSGYSSGSAITINNASGLHSEAWTKLFVYEKVNVNDCVLFDSLTGGSGHRIGITRTNKPFFESYNTQPVIATSTNNYSSKNVLSVSYLPNSVTIGLFNFNAQRLESQEFNYPFQVTRSDAQTLGRQFTGWWDQYIHYTNYLSPDVIGQWCSGFFARVTGYGAPVTTTCTTGITGYQNVFVGETGVTGYVTVPGGDEGRDYYTGAFPTFHTTTVLTGFLSSGLFSSGVAGDTCTSTTGDYSPLYEYVTGYASSFGMQKIQLFTPVISSDIVKASQSYIPFDDIYNKNGLRQYTGFQMAAEHPTGLLNLYLNGVAQAGSGWSVTGDYLIVSGALDGDAGTWDLKSGDKKSFAVSVGVTGFAFSYSGQEIYLNGVNLISGYDFVVTGSILSITNRNTGINGVIFEYPIVLSSQTGTFNLLTGIPFWRNTSNVYFNGVRQQNRVLYVEGAIYDLLSGNSFNYSGAENVYDGSNAYWEF